MSKPLADYVADALTLSWLTGPVFDKELRVSSRRRRNYVLRSVYLAVLTGFMALVWMAVVGRASDYGDVSYRTYQMSRAGVEICLFIVWFQFIGAQLISMIMCSTSISDEVYSKTLGVLMTTPVGSLKIVLGKIFSKLLQVVVLLLISLPLLAVVRVLGGVPWDFVVVSICMTLVMVLFVGSLSLFFSVFNRHAYLVIIETLLGLGVLFVLLPVIYAVVAHDVFKMSEMRMIGHITWVNPYLSMAMMSDQVMGAWRRAWVEWEVPCLVVLGASAVLLLAASSVVRKVAMRQATGQPVTFWSRRKKTAAASPAGGQSHAMEPSGALRDVTDPPVLWKELRSPLIRSRKWRLVATLVLLGILGITYIICAAENAFRAHDTQISYSVVLMIFATVCTAIFSSTTITAEKEARSWELLLLTDQSDWQILMGKLGGVLRRSVPFWLLLLGHVTLFTILGYIRPMGLLYIVIISAWVLPFLSCGGILFSTLFRKTTTAVIMNLLLALAIWAAVPFVAVMVAELSHHSTGRGGFPSQIINGNPVVQCVVTMEANTRSRYWYYDYYDVQDYYWPDKSRGADQSTAVIALWGVSYLIGAGVMLSLAKTCLRKKR